MLTVMQIARRIAWVIMGLILAGGLLHFFGPAELEREELIVIGALIVGLICFYAWLSRCGLANNFFRPGVRRRSGPHEFLCGDGRWSRLHGGTSRHMSAA